MELVRRSGLDAASSIDAVKADVIASLEEADASVRIRKTEFFNHTYAPDLVMSWDGTKTDRPVYLRATDSERYLAEDIRLLHERDPMIMPLDGIRKDDASLPSLEAGLDTVSRATGALVAERASFASLSKSLRATPVRHLAGRAVLQGGKGLVDSVQAADFGEAITKGFESALIGEQQATAAAVRFADSLLDTTRTAQLSELLQAAWVGGGNSTATFPGLLGSPSVLGPDSLMLLLDTVADGDPEFWSHIARRLDIEHLRGLTISAENVSFQALMLAGAPRLVAKAARISARDSAAVAQLQWAVIDGTLTLLIGSVRMQFASRSRDEFKAPAEDLSPDVRTFTSRARKSGANVQRIVLGSRDRRLEFASEDGTSVVADERVDALEKELGADTSVRRAVVASEGRDLAVDFATATVAGNTNARFELFSLARVAVALLVDGEADALVQIDAARDGMSSADDVSPESSA